MHVEPLVETIYDCVIPASMVTKFDLAWRREQSEWIRLYGFVFGKVQTHKKKEIIVCNQLYLPTTQSFDCFGADRVRS